MYSSGSIAILGIVALEAACTGMLCTLLCSMYVYAKSLCGSSVRTVRIHGRPATGCDSVAPSWLHVRDMRALCQRESAFESRVKGGFQGCDIATLHRGTSILFFDTRIYFGRVWRKWMKWLAWKSGLFKLQLNFRIFFFRFSIFPFVSFRLPSDPICLTTWQCNRIKKRERKIKILCDAVDSLLQRSNFFFLMLYIKIHCVTPSVFHSSCHLSHDYEAVRRAHNKEKWEKNGKNLKKYKSSTMVITHLLRCNTRGQYNKYYLIKYKFKKWRYYSSFYFFTYISVHSREKCMIFILLN